MRRKVKIELIMVGVTVVLMLVVVVGFWRKGFFGSDLSRYNQSDQPFAFNNRRVYFGDIIVEEEVEVEAAAVAEKLDLERKVVEVGSPEEADKIARIVEESGGEVISKGEVMVVKIPEGVGEEVESKLAEEGIGGGFEVDYPVALAAESIDWGVSRISAPATWEVAGGSGVVVAVIDTGIDYTHPDLAARYVGGYDFVNEDNDPFDDHGHGTHVAGIVAASLDDSGTVGVAPGSSIMAIKVIGGDGTGYVSDIVEGLNWVMAQGVGVVNLSLGTTYDSSLLRQKLQEVADSGIVVVAAAGNTDGGAMLYPAAYDSVISVGATDQADGLASFSALGAELAAPGVNITASAAGGGDIVMSGTSMAAPHVAGVVAAMLSNGIGNVRQGLRDTALDLGSVGVDSYFGYGLVQAEEAVLGEDTLPPVVSFVSPKNNEKVSGVVRVEINAQDERGVKWVKLGIDGEVAFEWSEEPYLYDWNVSGLVDGEKILLVEAADEVGNVGRAQIVVQVGEVLEATESASTGETFLGVGGGVSETVIDGGGGLGVIDNIEGTIWEQILERVPEVTNIYNRRGRVESDDHNENRGGVSSKGQSDKKVKGTMSSRYSEWLGRWFFLGK